MRIGFKKWRLQWWRIVACLLLAVGAQSAGALAPVAIVSNGELCALQGHIDFLPDSPDIDRGRLLAGAYDNDFHRYDDKAVTFQTTPYWLRMRISNNGERSRLVLSAGDVLYTEAELLYDSASGKPEGGAAQIINLKAGLLYPELRTRWQFHDTAFPILIETGESKTVYLRLNTPYFLLLDPYVADEMAYSAHQTTQASWGHLMVGIMLGVLMYLAMIALYVRNIREVLHCIAFVFVSFLVLLFGRGYIFRLLPDSAWLNVHLYSLIFSAQAFAYIAFSRHHFKTQQDFPFIDRLLFSGECIAAALFFGSVVMPIHWSTQAVGALAFLLLAMLCISSVYVWANSKRKLTVYILGTLTFLFVCILATAENTGLINLNGWPRRGYEIGLCLQTILFALALAEKINGYQKNQTQLAINAAEAVAESRAKSSFLAKMSHELRTPMNGLLGMLQLLDRTQLNDEQQHYMQVMRNSGRMLLGVIDDVLDYSRIIAGKLRIETSNYDLEEVLADIEAMFAPAARQKQLQLRLAVNGNSTVHVHGDVARLRQILINLVGNAIKFTQAGSVSAHVWVEHTSETAWVLRGEIEDTGIGITAEQMQLLFREYSQVNGANMHGGSGLGLAICKQLVEMMGGDIHVESAPGYGSLFRFSVLVAPWVHQETIADEQFYAGDSMRQDTRSARILVAEDNDTNRAVILGLLGKWGYQPVCVENGADAVSAVCQPHADWDLVLMDIEMPLLDGISATQRIREWETENNRDAVPIIALTAHAMRGYEEKTEQAGMSDHLTKPIDARQLQKLLHKWLVIVPA